jgi:thioredoxin reductase (NADPH)
LPDFDIAIVGAGPAGLSAALYAARFCRKTLVLHDGSARAARIPLTHNAPGFDAGIAGPDLLDRMTRHAVQYGARVVEAHVDSAEWNGANFRLASDSGTSWYARSLILATGVTMNQVPLDHATHEAAMAHGVLRYCPVCDGFEHRGQSIAVLGCDISGAAEALFLKTFSDDVTLLPRRDVDLTAEECADLEAAGVNVVGDAVTRYEPTAEAMFVHLDGQAEPLRFDVLYPALGTRPRSRLAGQLGLTLDPGGKAPDNAPFGTAMPGLYCAGDIVEGLDQISVAMGHGAVAATRAHNWLRARDGETVQAVLDEGDERMSAVG